MNRSDTKNKVAAVIPFYNESRTINEVIKKTSKHVHFIFAVDDGSTDNSVEQITSIEKVQIVTVRENRGKGFALRTGMNAALNAGYNKIVTLDADLQHNPDEIPLFLDGLKNYHIVIGNRLNNLKGMPLHRRMSNKITSKLLSIKTGQGIIDSQCGFRAYRSEILKNIQTVKNGYEAESEILIIAAKKNYKIGFVDIATIYGTERSKMNGFKATFDFVKLLFYSSI